MAAGDVIIKLRDALRQTLPYLAHKHDCKYRAGKDCTCGVEAITTRVRALAQTSNADTMGGVRRMVPLILLVALTHCTAPRVIGGTTIYTRDTVRTATVYLPPDTVKLAAVILPQDTVRYAPLVLAPDTIKPAAVILAPDTIKAEPIRLAPDTIKPLPIVLIPDTLPRQIVRLKPDTIKARIITTLDTIYMRVGDPPLSLMQNDTVKFPVRVFPRCTVP